jgi:hypothetical protein
MEANDNPQSASTSSTGEAASRMERDGAEDASFESLAPRRASSQAGADTWQLLLPSDEAMTILQASETAGRRAPGFGYWLMVALVAGSVFWISGGHVLLANGPSASAPMIDASMTTGSIEHGNEPAR